CPSYNKAIGGKSDSRHLRGLAADIFVASDSGRFALLRALLDHGFIRIGIGKSSIHADTDTTTVPLFWTYYP
ncbi:MAG: D-Ala-D-Ala carboxypeptidase family metallohydrolase, partial [Gammaproteobacteria bacterium]|nr:D-Ala-D-Ala carboxypeptidase family metallohydrolase [Gammaproteobacteria bacterium]